MNRSLTLALSVSFAAAFPLAASAATITAWNFDALGAQTAPYNAPPTSSGTGVATPLGMNNNYTYANNEGPGSIPYCDVLASGGASTGAGSFAWRVRGPTNLGGGGTGQSNGWNSQAPIATQGAQFAASTVGYSSITVTADVNVTGQAERNLAILYTLDDTAATPVWTLATITSAGSAATLATNSSSPNTVTGNYLQLNSTAGWNNQITASFPAAANNDANFAVELVNASTGADCVNGTGVALNNSSGNWRFDNVIISGTSAVPEPASLSVLAVGAMALIGRRRRGR